MFEKKMTAAPTKAQRSSLMGNNRNYNNTPNSFRKALKDYNATFTCVDWLSNILVKLGLAEYADGGFDNVL